MTAFGRSIRMTELFMKLLNMSINAGWLVLTVLLVRIIFRKAPKWLFPVLWSFVGIRLLMPNALESRLSVIPDISGFSASEQGALLSAKGFTAPVPYVGIVWCTGMAAMLLFEALSYVHLRSKVKNCCPALVKRVSKRACECSIYSWPVCAAHLYSVPYKEQGIG